MAANARAVSSTVVIEMFHICIGWFGEVNTVYAAGLLPCRVHAQATDAASLARGVSKLRSEVLIMYVLLIAGLRLTEIRNYFQLAKFETPAYAS